MSKVSDDTNISVMVWSGRRTGHTEAAESVKMETTAGGRQQSGFVATATIFSTPKIPK